MIIDERRKVMRSIDYWIRVCNLPVSDIGIDRRRKKKEKKEKKKK